MGNESAPGVSVRPHRSGRNRWDVMLWAGWGPDGRAIRSHRTFTGTRRQAVQFGVEALRRIREEPPDPAKHTVGSLFELFLAHKREQVKRQDRSDTTVRAYTSNLQRFVEPHPIARLRLRRLDEPAGVAHLVTWFTSIADSTNRKRPLSAKSLHHALSVMRSALRFGVQMGLLRSDPFQRFPRELWPRLHRGRPSRRSIDSAGLKAVRDAFRGQALEAEVALMCCGLRRGEILGLRARGGDEDPENGDLLLDGKEPRVRVRQVVVDAKGGPRVRPFPKSDASVRDVRLPAWAVPSLRAARRQALEVYMRTGRADERELLLFPNRGRRLVDGHSCGNGRAGDPRNPQSLNTAFRKRLGDVGLKGFSADRVMRVSPHALRHSFVSALINEAGMRAEDVQALAGHASLTTTQAYRSRDEAPAARAAEWIDGLMGER